MGPTREEERLEDAMLGACVRGEPSRGSWLPAAGVAREPWRRSLGVTNCR